VSKASSEYIFTSGLSLRMTDPVSAHSTKRWNGDTTELWCSALSK
jgi:hypothetical protein